MRESIEQPEACVLNARLLMQTLSTLGVITDANIKEGSKYKVAALVWNTHGEISYLYLRDNSHNAFMLPGECLRNKSLSVS